MHVSEDKWTQEETGPYVEEEEEPIWRMKNKDRMEEKLQRWVG